MKTIICFVFGLSAVLASPVILHDILSSSSKFAASVYKELSKQNTENFLVSPLSAQLILALAQSGSKGQTAKELQCALKLPPSKDLIDCIMNRLLQDLLTEHDYVFHTINKIYLKDHYPVKEDFATIAKEVYGTKIENINFSKKNKAANTINQWVEEETNNKIHDLIDPEILTNSTKAVLLNALLFQGNWSIPFFFFSTAEEEFHTFNGTINVQTMHIFEESFEFYEKPSLNATFLELPIAGENISMTIVLPNETDGLLSLEEHIDEVLEAPPQKFRDLFNVALPKFRMESRIEFKQILQNLGVKKAFEDGQADFTGMAGEKGELFIDDVVQKTFVDVNEDGIEAAAATFVVKIVNRSAGDPLDFNVDHPFLFFIKVEGLVVFVGRVVVPQY